MYHLPLPAAQIAELYPNCANRAGNLQLRTALLQEGERVIQRSATYNQMAQTSTLYQIAQENAVHVSNAELSNLYERALVNGGERPTYLAIRGAGLFGRCPLCAQRDVGTLDHYLPRASFPEFAVLPVNLVPCCFDCNHAKREHTPAAFAEQMFHPYFDDWNDLELIQATIVVEDAVYAEFAVNVDTLHPVVADRAAAHFETLGLAALYSGHASVELVQRRAGFLLTFENGGPEALQAELLRESQSRRVPFPNAWQPVLYRALADSDEFVNGGFYAIDDQLEVAGAD
ncbi:MAG: hypothetical protein LAO23_02390 [Acidobacteriia bacterium]|nr:hypothetical protein [Terriglobia bacterium]